MKNSQINIIVGLLTLIVILLGVVIYMLADISSSKIDKEVINTKSMVSIPGNEALELVKYYQSNNPIIVKDLKDNVDEPLLGFTFQKKDFETLLQHPSDSIMIAFGEQMPTDSASIKPNYHIIAVGVKDGKALFPKNMNEKDNNMIFDKAVPCPPHCPNWPK